MKTRKKISRNNLENGKCLLQLASHLISSTTISSQFYVIMTSAYSKYYFLKASETNSQQDTKPIGVYKNAKSLWSIMSKTNVPCQHSTNPYFLSRKWEKNVKEEGKKDQEHRISWNTNTKESLNLRVTTSKNVQLNIYQRETQNCIEN